jgi:hypothetical protein
MPSETYGDTPCCCTHCGIIFVAEMVYMKRPMDSKAKALSELNAGEEFYGRPCAAHKAQVDYSKYRLLRGPLRVPRPEPSPTTPAV